MVYLIFLTLLKHQRVGIMKKAAIAISILMAGVSLSGAAYAGTKATQVPYMSGKSTLPGKGLLNALGHANEKGLKGLYNAIEKQPHNKSAGC